MSSDLLHERPRTFPKLSQLRETVRFSFEGGDAAGTFEPILSAAPLAASGWDAAMFRSHLFLESLLDEVLSPDGASGMRGFLLRALSTPPERIEDTRFRQAIVRELIEDDALLSAFEELASLLRTLRDRIESLPSGPDDTIRRKIDILTAYRDLLRVLGQRFETCSSGLRRLHELGAPALESDAFRRLDEFLAFDQNLAVVDLKLRLGSDGRIRAFDVMSMNETGAVELRPSRPARFWRRLVAWFSGYRYTESEVVVRLIDSIFAPVESTLSACLALSGHVELFAAFLELRRRADSVGLAVSLPELLDGTGERHLEGLFNPLLLLQPDLRIRAVDLERTPHDAVVVLTGPNSGGKTRLLQALALTQLLGQVGGLVPARAARLVWAPKLFLSLVDESTASQAEGRLGSELLRVRQLFEQLEPGSVAILDELCSGTNPVEGEAIFSLVLELLPLLHPQVFISTHFLTLAARLEEERPFDRLSFLQVELDAGERPTFGFSPGVAETSLAHRVASRLGVTRGELEALVNAKLGRLPDPATGAAKGAPQDSALPEQSGADVSPIGQGAAGDETTSTISRRRSSGTSF